MARTERTTNPIVTLANVLITQHFDIPAEALRMFNRRITTAMNLHMRRFYQTIFHHELSQFIEAMASGKETSPAHVMRSQLLAIVAKGTEADLLGLSAQVKQPLASAPAAAAAAAAAAQAQAQAQGGSKKRKKTTHTATHQAAPGGVGPQPAGPQQQAVAPPTAAELVMFLSTAALEGDVQGIDRALAAGTSVDAIVPGGWTPLMNASLQGKAPAVARLLAARANIDCRDDSGYTALMYAAQHKHANVAEMLVAAGADMTVMDLAGRTVQFYATDASVQSALARGSAARGTPMN
jgi:hypothetical protein